jgi:cysteine dioxygenase type I
MAGAMRSNHDRALGLLDELLGGRSALEQRAREFSTPPFGRSWVCVFETTEADAWLISWSPLSHVGAHDHGDSRGVIHVLDGALTESYRSRRPTGGPRVRQLVRGSTVSVPVGRTHDVANLATQSALSLHVYSPRLTTMSFYPSLGSKAGQQRSTRHHELTGRR